jgi:hypothetical protein
LDRICGVRWKWNVVLTAIVARKALTVAAGVTAALAVVCGDCLTFTTCTASRASADDAAYRLIQEPDAGYSPIVGLISAASRSIRITMYDVP